MKRKGMRALAGVGLAAAMLLNVGCSMGEEEIVFVSPMSEAVVLTVGEETCTVTQMKLLLANNYNLYGTPYGINIRECQNRKALSELAEYVKNITVSQWTKVMSMRALAKEYDITLKSADMAMVENAVDAYLATLSREEIEAVGISRDDVVEMYELLALSDMVYEELTKDVSFEVSNDESRVMEAMIIYTEDAERAQTIEEELSDGSDFGVVATSYNEYPSIEMELYRGALPERVETQAFMLDDGERTVGIEADGGYYFIYCENKYNEELSNLNKQNIVEKRRTDAFNNIYNLFEENVDTRFNAQAWNSITEEDLSGLGTAEFFDVFDKYL